MGGNTSKPSIKNCQNLEIQESNSKRQTEVGGKLKGIAPESISSATTSTKIVPDAHNSNVDPNKWSPTTSNIDIVLKNLSPKAKEQWLQRGNFKWNLLPTLNEKGVEIVDPVNWVNHHQHRNIYIGQMKDGQPHGAGIKLWPEGRILEGLSLNGLAENFGRYIHSDGYVYEGPFVKGRKQGRGKERAANGDTYEGDYHLNQYHGHGVFTWADGSRYEGQFKHNKREGLGTLYFVNGGCYRGEFKKDMMHGMGVVKYNDGTERRGISVKNKLIKFID